MKKTVLITGASRGIGRETATLLANARYNVLINYNKSEKEAMELKKVLIADGCNVEIFKADITKCDEIDNMIEFCQNKFHNIDVLINNAGIAEIKPFMDLKLQDWENMINTNLNSIFYITQKVLENMIRNKSGSIINISSVWGVTGGSCEVHYSAAKAGIIGFTKALAKEMGPSNIRVNCLAPGAIDTYMSNDISHEEWEEFKKQVPLNRIGKTIDVAKCIKWLIEDEYTTGQVISVNGGLII